ncbi:two pore domain potassium channel family protein [Streptomyces kaniharaensis]|uniref:Two pore domain potassium channel family protein n=1 Tax=Streptomyces kaniharaensis TaxID=212423 RepID=A0A6N7KSZ2_9ACTN|nr:potassium channel family protein [Streptomyces kaniharaensis]MQS13457.1 two pore domain potassium channel family protein [Streptomyces kaniharaensis]
MSENPQRVDLPSTAWLLGSLTVLMTVYFTIPLRFFGSQRPALSWFVLIALLTSLGALLLTQILAVLQGTSRRPVVGLIFLICLAVIVFSATYYVFAARLGEFKGLETRLDALYFTVVTMATVGYGDITPSGQDARLVVILQICYNFVFLAAAAGTLTRTIRSNVETRIQRKA